MLNSKEKDMKNRLKIKNKTTEYLGNSKEFLKDMISYPSTSTNEKGVVECIKAEMENVGFDEVIIDGFGNILGRVGNGSRVIAMDAHIDVVDKGNEALWKTPPFQGVEKNGIIYGRGASDQKGGMAAMVYAAKIMKEMDMLNDFTVWITGSVQEEDCDGLCWQYIIKEKVLDPLPEVVVITEPTNLNLYRGHRGRMEMEVETAGISCHGSEPNRGENAVTKMADIIKEIDELNHRLEPTNFLGKGTVAVTKVSSISPSLCAVPDKAVIHLDRRLTEGETEEIALDQIRSLPSFKKHKARVRVLEYDTPSYKGTSYPTRKYYPTWVIPEDHQVVKAGIKAAQNALGKKPVVDKWIFSTNGVATCGMFDIPTIGFGPANEIHAHSPEDQLPIVHLQKAMAFYVYFLESYGENIK
ncbi:MAG: YgeY family selenium metabolism-linked hydrolase [Myxococcota bacterium]